MSVDEGAEFGKDKRAKDGLIGKCKKCLHKYQNQYYKTEKGRTVRKEYEQSKGCKANRRKYQQSAKCKEARKRHFQTTKCKETVKKYYKTEKGRAVIKRYRQSVKYKEACEKHLKSAKYKETKKKRYVKNKISNCLSSAIRLSLKGNKNGQHWEDIAGWTLQQFKNRFVQLFKPGMTWKNHGAVWEIDHIVPLSVHNITSIDCTDFKRAWALSNLQPLFREENQSKRDKLEKHFQLTLF